MEVKHPIVHDIGTKLLQWHGRLADEWLPKQVITLAA